MTSRAASDGADTSGKGKGGIVAGALSSAYSATTPICRVRPSAAIVWMMSRLVGLVSTSRVSEPSILMAWMSKRRMCSSDE
jgi:hypothetical protein